MLPLLLMLAAAQAAPVPAAIGDFDHDGAPDKAFVGTAADGSSQLIVELASRRAPYVIAPLKPSTSFYIETLTPGRYDTACGKGTGRARDCPGKQVTLAGDTLAFGTREASRAVAVWNGTGFDTVWLSD
ncbi:hypothetical protein AB2M62_11780 [Sphingomonas sp. MMS12-HWE2-04]|uniref:hypothetical protein n=1 Tax=Sphingomonas sp. MMS12-HWE2-04 TaxID=3234199 RepID=UPI00384DF56F